MLNFAFGLLVQKSKYHNFTHHWKGLHFLQNANKTSVYSPCSKIGFTVNGRFRPGNASVENADHFYKNGIYQTNGKITHCQLIWCNFIPIFWLEKIYLKKRRKKSSKKLTPTEDHKSSLVICVHYHPYEYCCQQHINI